jgi:hypothetical protein
VPLLPYLLIAKALGLMVSSEHPKTGAPQLLLRQKDEDGFDLEPIYLGETFVDSYNKLDLSYLEQLNSQVTKLLAGDYLPRYKRNQLKTIVLSKINRIKQVEGGDDLNHPSYQRFNEGGKTAVKILKT